MSSNDVALFSKEWHFSDEWEQFSSEEAIRHETSEQQSEIPLLNQDEIESLLNHYKLPKKQATSGLEQLLGTKNPSYNNFTLLENILKDFSQECLNDWRSALLMSDVLEFSLEDKELVSLKHYMDKTLMKGITRVIKSPQSDSPLLINFSSECLYLLIESLLGGSQAALSFQTNERPLTRIENNISLYFMEPLLTALERAFHKFMKYDFYLEKKNDLSEIINLSYFSDKAFLVKFRFRINSSTNVINLFFPITFLEDLRQKLEKANEKDKKQYTAVWQNYLAKGLEQTNLKIEAKLSTITSSLEEILSWKIGTQISLPLKPSSLISLESEGLKIMEGEMGQCDNSVAIQIKRNKLGLIKEKK